MENWENYGEDFKKKFKLFNRINLEDEKLYFYYDESNNIRVFRNRENGFNIDSLLNFAVGGVVFINDINCSAITQLISKLNIDKRASELKLKLFLNNKSETFLKEISNRKLVNFLKLLNDINDVYIHFNVINVLYYSIVDVIDDILRDGNKIWKDQKMSNQKYSEKLKNFLYMSMISDLQETARKLYEVHFPNIEKEREIEFLEIIKNFIEKRKVKNGDDKDTKKDLTRLIDECILKIKKGKFNLLLCKDNDSKIKDGKIIDTLIKNFQWSYIFKILLYPKSEHVFDEEYEIQNQLENNNFSRSEYSRKYSFVNSKSDINLQISDVIIGLIAKLFDFISLNNNKAIKKINILSKDDDSKKVLYYLQSLLRKSNSIESTFFYYSIAETDKKVFSEFLNMRIEINY